jgi:hypothetical protein
MEMISGINSVTRGQPDESLKSGVALALVQSMSVQFNSMFQAQWAKLLEDVASFIIELLKDFAKTERIVSLVGKHNRNLVRSFTGEDLDAIQRVLVNIGNPLTSTTSGKLAMAQDLLSNGIIKTPDQYLTVLETGNIEPLTDGLSSELDLIARENDSMMEGKDVVVMAGDNHRLHYAEHRSLLSDPEIRMNGSLTPRVLMHMQEHLSMFKSEDPLMSILIGEQPAATLSPQAADPAQMDFAATQAVMGEDMGMVAPAQPPVEQLPLDAGGIVPPPVV